MTTTLPFSARTETVEFDRAVLSALCRKHGVRAESVLTERLAALARALDRAEAALAACETGALDGRCAVIARDAERIGMTTLVRAAEAVRGAIAAGDGTAVAACAARMLRLGRPDAAGSWTVRRGTVA